MRFAVLAVPEKGTAAYPAWRAEAGGTISARSAAVNRKMDILTRGYVASREYQFGVRE